MSFYVTFDKDENKEFLLFRNMIKKGNITYSEPLWKKHIAPIGTFLLMFLNTDFTDEGFGGIFIRHYCFESLYYEQHPEEKQKNSGKFISLQFEGLKYDLELWHLIREY